MSNSIANLNTKYNQIYLQNQALSNAIATNHEKYSADYHKIEYKSQGLAPLQTAKTVLFYIYYGIFIIMAFFVWSSTMKRYIKIIILFAFAAFPFAAFYLENMFYQKIIMRFWKTL